MRLVVDDAGAEYPVTIDPLITSPAWTVEGNIAGATFGAAVSTAGDVNGDGYSDVLVGAPRFNSGSVRGKVFLYLGSVTGLATSPSWSEVTSQSETSTRLCGRRLSTVLAALGPRSRETP